MDQSNGLLSAEKTLSTGRELAAQYQSGEPFPHIVIDDFLPPALLDECLHEFPQKMGLNSRRFDTEQERKTSYHPDTLPPKSRFLFYSFNSRPFVQIIENITGISGLIPDPYFSGAGFHELKQGGHLSVHADFNHHKPMNLERRVNVLIYLNKNWASSFGGQLELWDRQMTRAVHSVVPLFNRCVIFNTTLGSNHGNPQPINHPNGISRKSIALYYYTATWATTKKSHSTLFRARPASDDKDWNFRDIASARFREIALDWAPPVLIRKLRRATEAQQRD
jgi:hypothetical protein